MNWFYESSGQQQGPVSESALDALLRDGTITPETRVWHDGMAEWLPLREARPTDAVPAAPPLPSGEGTLPPGYVRCSLTGKAFPETEMVYIQGKPYSAEAKPIVLQTIQRGGTLPVLERERHGLPWENRAQLGRVAALWKTITGVLFKPSENFREMKRTGGLWPPLLFYIILGTVGFVVGIIYEVLGNRIAGDWGRAPDDPTGTLLRDLLLGSTTSWSWVVYWAIAAPFIVTAVAFVGAGMTHLALILLQAARQPFETTFRVTCYASGAIAALGLLPLCGDIFGAFWYFAVMTIGVAKTHEVSTGRAFLAAILPLVACCGGGVAAFGIFGSQIPWGDLGLSLQ